MVKFAVPTKKQQMWPKVFQSLFHGGKTSVIRHFQFDDTFGNPRHQGFLHLGLFFFYIQAGGFGIQIVRQGSEQQNAQGSGFQLSLVSSDSRYAAGKGITRGSAQKALFGVVEYFPWKLLNGGVITLNNDGLYSCACHLSGLLKIARFIQHLPEALPNVFQLVFRYQFLKCVFQRQSITGMFQLRVPLQQISVWTNYKSIFIDVG